VLKSALGSTETVEWEQAESTLAYVETLKVEGVQVYAIEQTENSVFLQDFERKPGLTYAFVLGNEVSGVDQLVIDSCHGALEIQQHGTKHSLNVAVCAGVVMHSLGV
jgi:tRNA G18 (ribose-2'-O)-methylase SpoU